MPLPGGYSLAIPLSLCVARGSLKLGVFFGCAILYWRGATVRVRRLGCAVVYVRGGGTVVLMTVDDGGTFSLGSLFSGIGGLELGLERAGLGVTRWQCEVDVFCRRVLARHWRGIPVYGDVRSIVGTSVAPVDVLCGGFPCQDLSAIQRLNRTPQGLDGARSGLWWEYLRVAKECGAPILVIENVSSGKGLWLRHAVESLKDGGWYPTELYVRAADVGSPQSRDRTFLVGLADAGQAREDAPALAHRGSDGCRQASLAAGLLRSGGREYCQSILDRAVVSARRAHMRRHEARHGKGADLPAPDPYRGVVESRVGGATNGLSSGLDLWRSWPAWRGEAQHPWEPERQVRGRANNRQERLAALGNSVSPAVAEVVGLFVVYALAEATRCE